MLTQCSIYNGHFYNVFTLFFLMTYPMLLHCLCSKIIRSPILNCKWYHCMSGISIEFAGITNRINWYVWPQARWLSRNCNLFTITFLWSKLLFLTTIIFLYFMYTSSNMLSMMLCIFYDCAVILGQYYASSIFMYSSCINPNF